MTLAHYFGIAVVLLLITATGIYSGKKVNSATDFASGGRKTGTGIVVGSIIGTLVGGSSTIGTAQLAYSFGFSAWWYTLGGGLGCLVLGLFFTKPFYESGIQTLPQIFTREYGPRAGLLATTLTSLGALFSIISQMLSGIALLAIVSNIGVGAATMIVVVLMLAYIVFGGVWGAGMAGIAKTAILYPAVGICGILAVRMQGGFHAFYTALPTEQYFSLVGRGLSVDLGAGLSMILGVLTSHTYVQAVISARSLKVARRGAMISAALTPLIGIAGVFVGMYMQLHHPGIEAASSLPVFIMENVPPLWAGILFGALIVALVGSGAGTALGLGTTLCSDFYKVYINKNADDKKILFITRSIIAAVLCGCALFTLGNVNSLILSWGFLSMALRGAVAFAPVCAALFLPGRIPTRFVTAAMLLSPATVLLGKFLLPPQADPLTVGVVLSIVLLAMGALWSKYQTKAP